MQREVFLKYCCRDGCRDGWNGVRVLNRTGRERADEENGLLQVICALRTISQNQTHQDSRQGRKAYHPSFFSIGQPHPGQFFVVRFTRATLALFSFALLLASSAA